ncbi:alpha-E domain-containing protein [Janibacter sp. G1551]|uniref:alpha-E domain-containing protein n=1 Tax=Janibacter sp. G1551 TaxID=3420440 RepID=UPI003D08275F
MLSRIAESLFWIGRYVERADGTARIVDVLRLQDLEDSRLHVESASHMVLTQIMGLEVGDEPVGYRDVAERLVLDRDHPSSIVGSIWAARENARRARETLSTELWEAINMSWHQWVALGSTRVTARHLSWVRERAALIGGIAASTMSHDEAWDYFTLGRSLERADMTARLVATGALPREGESAWSTVLQSCGAHQAYLRTNRGLVEDDRAAAFLVLDRRFPRSIVFALTEAEASLARLAPTADRIGFSDEAVRQLGRIRTSLEYRSFVDVLEEMPAHMDSVQSAINEASDAIARRYFQTGTAPAWTEELA